VFLRASYISPPSLHAVVCAQVACVSSLAAACPATLHAAALDGSLPLHLAASAGSQAVCAALLAAGADACAVNPVTGQRCWQVATRAPLAGWLQGGSTRSNGGGRGGGSGLSTETRKRSPAEELERTMLIWNV
jgi:ankyrin repeat protein